jgi:hypothetical protein
MEMRLAIPTESDGYLPRQLGVIIPAVSRRHEVISMSK